MPPRSKRKRKTKDKFSLKIKSGGASQSDGGLEYEDDSNAVILPAKPDTTAQAATDGADDEAEPEDPFKNLSKSQQRKLRKVMEEKALRAKRAEVFQSLAQHHIPQEELALFRSVSAVGQKDTKKQALRRALQLERAGVELPEDMQLYRERGKPAAPSEMDDDDNESESESGSDSQQELEGAASFQKGATTIKQQSPNQQPAKKQKTAITTTSPIHPPSVQQLVAGLTKEQQDQLRHHVQTARKEIELTEGDTLVLPSLDIDDVEEQDLGALPAAGRQPVAPGPARVVHVERTPEITESRSGLPIIGMEQEVMEAISNYDVLVLCGETGCGKTTQVPQFLYEAGYGSKLFPDRGGMVGVTQPRRVAAASTAARVAEELATPLGKVVGYQVRYDRRVGGDTAIKFMTDGILLRELREDFLLRRYSVIIVDEAHERSLNTDILLGMLSRIVALRRSMASASNSNRGNNQQNGSLVYPLKLIVMSATLRIEDFVANKRLFPVQPPVVHVPARQYPVTVHFSRKTEMHDYVGAAFKKVCQIHRMLPPGGILVFLTGQREVEHLCKKLRKALTPRSSPRGGGASSSSSSVDPTHPSNTSEDVAAGVDVFGDDIAELDTLDGGFDSDDDDDDDDDDRERKDDYTDKDKVRDPYRSDGDSSDESGDEDEVVIMGGEGLTPEEIAEAEKRFDDQLAAAAQRKAKSSGSGSGGNLDNDDDDDNDDSGSMQVHVLPLYAMLSSSQQARVFQPPPPGHRLIIVATNAAETSITIPGMRYVVDAGRSKQRLLEQAAGLARFEVRWVSKSSAEQRAGRAGRTGPGHCYRLFSSAVYNDIFPQHTPPEIVNTSLEGVVLSLKSLGVEKIHNFPFPTPPEAEALKSAESCLIALSAIDPLQNKLTELGIAMAMFPISPRHARMLLEVAGRQAAKQAQQLLESTKNISSSNGASSKKAKKKKNPVDCLPHAIALAAALSVESPFIHIDGLEGTTAAAAAGDEGNDNNNAAPNPPPTSKDKYQQQQDVEAAKQRRHAAKVLQSKLRVPESDALSALNALCAFEAAGEDEDFCRRNHLHFRNLREAAALRRQLARTIQQQHSQKDGIFAAAVTINAASSLQDPPASPPSVPVLENLRRALAAGWADQVARRVRSLEYVKGQIASHSGGKKKVRAVRYQSPALEEEIFLHPNSALHATAPEFIVYSELVRTVKRPYMAGVTTIDPRWLPAVAAPLCTFSAPLSDPAPYYNPTLDSVMAWRDVTFGGLMWPIPRYATQHPDPTERAAVFAGALLDGSVLPSMKELKSVLAVSSAMAVRADMRMHKRVADLVSVLAAAGVDSKSALAEKWENEPNFGKFELRAWMRKGAEGQLDKIWKVLLEESKAQR